MRWPTTRPRSTNVSPRRTRNDLHPPRPGKAAPRRETSGALTPPAPLVTGGSHRSHQITEVAFLVVEEPGVTDLHSQGGQDRVLVRERVPAECREVEDEALRCDARLLRSRRERGERLLHGAADELGDAA